jgi:hypothetical protein
MRRLPGPPRPSASRRTPRKTRGAGGWPDRRSVAAADAPDKPQSDSSPCGLARRCRSGGYRGPRDPGKRKRFGSLRHSRLSLGRMADRGEGAATSHHLRPRPPGSFGARWRASGRTNPRAILRIRRGKGRILSEVGVRSRGRARSGSTRTSDSIAHADGFAARHARKHSSRPLQEEAQGSIGPETLATASPRSGLGSG